MLLPACVATTDSLEALRNAGAQAVLVVGTLSPRPALRPVHGLMVVQILPETAMRLMRTSRFNLATQLGRSTPATWRLPRALRLRVETQALPVAGALNVLSYAPGKHPARARELVIVCTDLDAVGTFAGVPTLDTAHLGVSTAARVSTYAYVNPAVAVLLGWLLAGERLDARAALAVLIILSAVVVVSMKGGDARGDARRPN